MQRADSPADSPSSIDHEIEWQFVVDGPAEAQRILERKAAAAGLALDPLGEQRLHDRYLDTERWSFHRAGFALRLRDAGGPVVATLKALDGPGEGAEDGEPLRRLEISERLSAAYPLEPLAALLAGSGPVARRVRDVTGRAGLRILFTLHTARRRFTLRSDGATLAEAAIDATSILGADGSVAGELQRLEIEVGGNGTPEAVEPLARRLREDGGLRPAAASKFEAALAARALEPAGTPDLGATGYDATSSLGEVARAALRRQLAASLANEPGTRLGEDIEALHRMRVASRRTRAVIRVFAEALPRELPALREEWRWIGDALGEVRDLDVQIEALAEDTPDLAPLREQLEAARAEARTELLAALNSPRYEALIVAMTEALRDDSEAGGEAARPAIVAAPELLRDARRRLRRLARRLDAGAPATEYHRARIRAKRVRYATECVADLYGPPAHELIEALKELQDVLGRSQDALVAIERLSGIAGAGRDTPPATLFAMGRLAEREAGVLAGRDEAFRTAWRRFRKRWKRFDRALDEGAPCGGSR